MRIFSIHCRIVGHCTSLCFHNLSLFSLRHGVRFQYITLLLKFWPSMRTNGCFIEKEIFSFANSCWLLTIVTKHTRSKNKNRCTLNSSKFYTIRKPTPNCTLISFVAVGEIYTHTLSRIANQWDRARVRAQLCCLYILNFSHHNNSFLKLLVGDLNWRSLLANAPPSVPELCCYYSRIPVNQSRNTAVAAI